jgi:hypothetical protein
LGVDIASFLQGLKPLVLHTRDAGAAAPLLKETATARKNNNKAEKPKADNVSISYRV